MDETGFRWFLKKFGKKDQVIDGLVSQVHAFETFLLEKSQAGLENASEQDLRGYLESLPERAIKERMRGLSLYFGFIGNAALARLAGEIREKEIAKTRRSFRLRDFCGVHGEDISRLEAVGVVTVDDLLLAGKTPDARRQLSLQTGVSPQIILELVKLSDLSRIGAVKSVRARLYYDAGLDTPDKFSQWDPEALREYLVEWVERTGFDGIAPLPKELRNAVANAHSLPKIVEYAPAVFATLFTDASEARAVRLLVNSIRTFGGSFCQSPIWVFYPADLKVDHSSLDLPGVQRFPITLDEPYKSYPFAYRAYAPAQAATFATQTQLPPETRSFIWMDYAAVFLNPPALFEISPEVDAAVRPVFVRNVGSPIDEPIDAYWQAIYQAVGLEDLGLLSVQSTEDGQILRPYFNCGGYALNPATNLPRLWWEYFQHLVCDTEFQQQVCQDEEHRTFLHQAVFSALITKEIPWERIRVLPASYGAAAAAPSAKSTADGPVYFFSYEAFPDRDSFACLRDRPELLLWLQKQQEGLPT